MSAFEIAIPAIHVNHKIYLPMLDTIFTKENMMDLPMLNYDKQSKKNQL